jgi:hypothetical protein
MRTLMRAGAIALASTSALLGTAVAAQAAPAPGITVSVNRLVLQPGESGHTGAIRIVIHNGSDTAYTGGNVAITEPIADSFSSQITGAWGCVYDYTADHRRISACGLDEIPAGGTAVVTQGFQSPAKPRPYAQIAPAVGSVAVGDVAADFPALFRSTIGSLRNPRPYVQATTQALTVTAPSNVTLTRQADGTFAGSVPVRVKNHNDAAQTFYYAQLAAPGGLDQWPAIDPSTQCLLGADGLSVPEGGIGVTCYPEGMLAEGQTRTTMWTFHAPADAAPGLLGTVTTKVDLGSDAAAAQTDGANLAAFTLTVAG